MCNMFFWGEYGGGMGWNETGWVFRGDAKLAHSAVWLDVFVEGRDFCLGGRGIGAGAWFGWGVVVEGRDFCFGGTRNWRRSAIPLDVFVSLWVE